MNRIVVVSNRVQVPQPGAAQAGGLAVALDSLMAKRGGLWFGWSGKLTDAPSDKLTEADVDGVHYAMLDLTHDEHDRYYNGFSNATLWPLLHSMPQGMAFDRRSADAYREVNRRFVAALAPLLRPNDLIWLHDYHLMAMPALLRATGVRAPIGFFLHIPFPSPDMLASVPEAGTLVRDLLASDLLGFQTQGDADNFCAAAHRFAGASPLPDGRGVRHAGRDVRIGVFPVEIEARDFAAIAEAALRGPTAQRLRRSLHDQALILGIDRLDPTKGLLQRLAGYRRLLETRPQLRHRMTFLQIAAESRTEVSAYRQLRMDLDQEAGAINSEWGEADWTPLRIVARGGARAVVAGYMRQARVGLVTPLRDGMNLVAKEYVAAQDPANPGVLVLSRFAGAARQLPTALLVNPHDADEIADAIDRALNMPLAERIERWRAAWQVVEAATPARWGRFFLTELLRAAAPTPAISAPRLPRPREPISLGFAEQSSVRLM